MPIAALGGEDLDDLGSVVGQVCTVGDVAVDRGPIRLIRKSPGPEHHAGQFPASLALDEYCTARIPLGRLGFGFGAVAAEAPIRSRRSAGLLVGVAGRESLR